MLPKPTVGKHNIPSGRKQATIFVSNHPNQFVDAANIISGLEGVRIRFLTAAKSMRRRVIGDVARALGSIPVERSQDLATGGKGTISIMGGRVVGNDTTFKTQGVTPGAKLKFATPDLELTVTSVESETSLEIVPCAEELAGSYKYKILPKLDQTKLYESVYKALEEGSSIGIFPEGGSHDRVGRLLDLKPGVAIMALGALLNQPQLESIKIVPIGLNYFEPYRFRSSLVMEIGAGFEITQGRLVEQFRKGGEEKRAAVAEVMKSIYDAMQSCIVPSESFQAYKAIHLARKLYVPDTSKLTATQQQQLNRRLAVAYSSYSKEPKGKELLDNIMSYQDTLAALHIRDRDVVSLSDKSINLWTRLTWYLRKVVTLFALSWIAFPSLLMFSPVALLCSTLSRKEKARALAASNVKEKGLDVVASYKLLVGVVFLPIYNLCLTAALAYTCHLSVLAFFAVYFLGLPVAQYLMIIVDDIWVVDAKEVFQQYKIFLSGKAMHLRDTRLNLMRQVRQLSTEIGPAIFGSEEAFEKQRIVRLPIDLDGDGPDVDAAAAAVSPPNQSKETPPSPRLASFVGRLKDLFWWTDEDDKKTGKEQSAMALTTDPAFEPEDILEVMEDLFVGYFHVNF